MWIKSERNLMFRWWLRLLQRYGAESAQEAIWRTITAVIVFSMILMLGVGWLMFSLTEDMSRNREATAALIELTADLNRYEKSLVDLETGQRGFLLTHEEEYLEPFNAAMRELPKLAHRIKSAVSSHEESNALFGELEGQAQAKILELQLTHDLSKSGGTAAALALVNTDRGKRLMDAVRAEISLLLQITAKRVVQLREGTITISIKRNYSMATMLLLALLGSLASLWMMRRYAQAELAAQQERVRADTANAASAEKSRFLANMSHEIRTPMNAIFGFSQLLGESVTDPKDKFYASAITQSGKVLLGLINDILDMSKIEAGRLELAAEPTNLRALLSGVEVLFLQMASEKQLGLQLAIQPSLPDAVVVDPLRLRQILINLIGNAIKYTERGRIVVTADGQPNAENAELVDLRFVVEDTGNGIAADQIQTIFEPFTQLHKRDSSSGAGLGLSIVKRLVQMMGGEISVDSVVGVGSRFVVTLPNLARSSDAAPLVDDTLDLATLPKLRILVVDDIELNRQLLESMFASSHHQVLIAADGLEGVKVAQKERPDVVFMDIRMPGMDGVDALQVIRENPELQQTKIVAATASSLLGGESRIRNLFDGYLRKPLTKEGVADVLHRLFKPAQTAEQPHSASESPTVSMPEPSLAELVPLTEAERSAYLAQAEPLKQHLSAVQGTMSTDALRELIATISTLPEAEPFADLHRLKHQVESAASIFDLAALDSLLPQVGRSLLLLDRSANPESGATE